MRYHIEVMNMDNPKTRITKSTEPVQRLTRDAMEPV